MPITENKAKLDKAIAAWIADAQGRKDGARLLESKASMVNGFMHRAGLPDAPREIDGLSVYDLSEARDRLALAALRLMVTV